MSRNFKEGGAQLLVAAAIGGHLALLALQNLTIAPAWLAELSRFLPFYWLLAPLCAALLAALLLRPVWLLAALGNLALFGICTMDMHWQLPLGNAGAEAAGTQLRVLSYNIKALSARQRQGGLAGIEFEVGLQAPDIVALQDAQYWLTEGEEAVRAATRPVFGLPYVMTSGQYVLASRYPLHDCKTGMLDQTNEPARYLLCSARIGSKDVQLVTAHFVSPRTALMATRRAFYDGIEGWQANLALRLRQSQALLAVVSRLPMPLLVMGDFNALVSSPVLQDFKRIGLVDAFAEGGSGWGYTQGHALRQHLDLFRIDHILVGAGLQVRSAEVGRSEASEHRPVIADVWLRP